MIYKKWLNICLPIFIGGLIYVLFRVDSLSVFRFIELAGLDNWLSPIRERTMTWEVNSFIKYSLPDGLWVYSFSYFIFSIWLLTVEEKFMKYLFISTPLLFGIGGEIAQLAFPIIGTFDWQDLFISLVAYLLAFVVIKFNRQGDIS